jgi:hypothetical protein
MARGRQLPAPVATRPVPVPRASRRVRVAVLPAPVAVLAAALVSLLLLALPVAAQAVVTRPGVFTGAAETVSYGSATLTGSIDPHGSNTSYYFQYGLTRAYGAQTAIADAGAGLSAVRVSVPITGLQPLTTYYFRLIAVNAAGATTGANRAFVTTKVPLSLAILVAPNPTLYGGDVTIQGTLSGTGAGGLPVVLQANPFPYTQGFANLGNPELTTAAGGFSFPVLGLTAATQFRAVTTTRVPVVSPVATEAVAVRVEAHVGRTRRRHHARIYGTVTPAVDGAEVAVMRITGGANQLVAGTALRHGTTTTSRFSCVVRVHRGAVYRVLVRVTNGAQTSNYSEPLFIR